MLYEQNIYQNKKENYNQLFYNKRFKKIVFAFLGVLSLSLDPSQAGSREKLPDDIQEEHVHRKSQAFGKVVKNTGKAISHAATAAGAIDLLFGCVDFGLVPAVTVGIGKAIAKAGDKIEKHASHKK